MTKLSDISGLFSDEGGAVTVDWVTLTTSAVVIGIGLVYSIYGGEDGPISTIITNYNAELDVAADNLSGVVGDPPPPLDQSTSDNTTPTFLDNDD